jgi:cytochrome P450
MAESSESFGDALPDQTPPGPGGLPLVGNSLDLYRDAWGFYAELAEYGDVVAYSALGNDFTALLHPDYVEQVLLTDHDQYGKWGFESIGSDFGAEGLVQTEGEQWRRQRTIVQDAFTMERIREYADTMGADVRAAVDNWDDGEEIALDERFSRLTLRILTRSLFDMDLEGGAGQVAELTEVVEARTDINSLTAMAPLWLPLPSNRRFKRVQSEFESFVEALIEQRRGSAEEYDDLLSLLLAGTDESGQGMTDVEIRDQMSTFLFAGHETTSLALTYACMELATRPALCERLRSEYEECIDGRTPSFEELLRLTETERVIKETLRLYPPAYIIFREAGDDVAVGDYRVPAGTKLTLPQFWIHRDERFYDDPEQFRPDRWTEDFEDDLHDYAYFPFGGGPRHCIGMRFAMLELKTALATILPAVAFELISDPDPAFSFGVTLRPREPVRVRVEKR